MVESTYREERYTLDVGYNEPTGHPKWMTVKLNGQLHSPPDGRPAHVVFDTLGRQKHRAWYRHGMPHRDGGPAIIDIDPDTGVLKREEYRMDGLAHREGAEPAYIERDPKTGKTVCTLYCLYDEVVDEPQPLRSADRSPTLEP